MTMHYKPAGLT